MGCRMTVPDAVPPLERLSVENCFVVPRNVPPFQRGYDPQLTQQIQAVPAERQQTKTGPGLRSFSDRSVPLAPLESGTVERSRARTLTEAKEGVKRPHQRLTSVNIRDPNLLAQMPVRAYARRAAAVGFARSF